MVGWDQLELESKICMNAVAVWEEGWASQTDPNAQCICSSHLQKRIIK